MSDNKELTWRHLKALNDLYKDGWTKAKIADHPYVKHLISKKILAFKVGNHNILQAKPSYSSLYESKFRDNYKYYDDFFSSSGLPNDGKGRYLENDIKTLIFIRENKSELKASVTTERTFSAIVFNPKGSKYLGSKIGLKNAVCLLLGINDFPDKDPKNNQMRLVVDCQNPEVIVLCENMNNLKSPWEKRKCGIELWYVGGNNIAIIDEIPKKYLTLPIYYSCDWDYAGLSIYSKIKEKILEKGASLQLLEPKNLDHATPVDSENHKSKWSKNTPLSGLNSADFSASQQSLIKTLIENNKWIEEESTDLVQLITDRIAL